MWLTDLYVVGAEPIAKSIRIEGSTIQEIHSGDIAVDNSVAFQGALVFPGLINAHDHLEFNLFPQLRGQVYQSYLQWGTDIHARYKMQIEQIMAIPRSLRVQWGLVKNLINGVTTVVDHGRNEYPVDTWIELFSRYTYLHSVGLEKYWKVKLNHPFSPLPVMVHVGEGVTTASKREIDQLLAWNMCKRDFIGIHGIAMDESQAARFKALVWCPASNFFLYEKTAPIDKLKDHVPILFGTDSALSAVSDIWEQLREALATQYLSREELFASVTRVPSEVLGLNKGLATGKPADLVIVRRKHQDPWESFYSTTLADVLMVIKNGRIMYFDTDLKDQLEPYLHTDFQAVEVQGREKYLPGEICDFIQHLNRLGVDLPLPITLRS